MYDEITTARLSLRPVALEDVDALHALFDSEPVRRFLWDGEVIPVERTREVVATSLGLFDAHGFGILGIRESGRIDMLGFTGFWHFRTPPSRELLFGVAPEHWNRGIATEAARGVIGHAFARLGFPSVEASTDVGNTASVRVLEKLGMRLVGREVVDGLDTNFFRIPREAWEDGTGQVGFVCE